MASQAGAPPQTANAQNGGGGTGERSPSGVAAAPPGGDFHWARQAAETLPPLAPMAFPIVRDRWERLVTTAMIPAPPERVWAALTDPEQVRMWLGRLHGPVDHPGEEVVLDFEDGEFFLVRPECAEPPETDSGDGGELRWIWRWLGIGQAASVTWRLDAGQDGGTAVTATEECMNPPADWQTWNGGGWPGILDQLASFLRTGTEWRWPWRRMGPYVQVELAASPFEAWDTLMNPAAIKFWLQRMSGDVRPGESLTLMMGDASGTVQMAVREVVDAGQKAPSFLPYVDFGLQRPAFGGEIGGRLWIEPAGMGRSLLQVFHYGWEALPPGPALLDERRILTSFWAGAARRAAQTFMRPEASGGPHSWT
jgi:uncharacterized protein YndB with AHSA1/START domain